MSETLSLVNTVGSWACLTATLPVLVYAIIRASNGGWGGGGAS